MIESQFEKPQNKKTILSKIPMVIAIIALMLSLGTLLFIIFTINQQSNMSANSILARIDKIENGIEYFKYVYLYLLSGYSFDKFLHCVENGIVFVDFDARSGHNHGVKFRIKQKHWSHLYSDVRKLI